MAKAMMCTVNGGMQVNEGEDDGGTKLIMMLDKYPTTTVSIINYNMIVPPGYLFYIFLQTKILALM